MNVIPLTVERARIRFKGELVWRQATDISEALLCYYDGLYAPTKSGQSPMANSAQARKRARQAEVTRKRNASLKSALRTAVKKIRRAIATGDKSIAAKTFQESQSVLDNIADKRIVHKNLVSRTKSRLSSAIKGLAA